MDFTRFRDKTAAGVRAYLGEGVRVETTTARKNNGVILEGISISSEGVNISPTIYLNDFYAEYCDGASFSTIIRQLVRLYEQTRMKNSMNMDFFLDFEKVRPRLIYRLVNYDRNRTLLEEIPHIPFLDMALTFQCLMLQEEMGNATIQITNEHCRMWQVDEKELYEQAEHNTQKYLHPIITGMEEVVRDMVAESLREEFQHGCPKPDTGAPEEWIGDLAGQMLHGSGTGPEELSMFVLSNQTRIHGACAILYQNVLRQFAKEQQHNFYILPSSVHEVILIPDSGRENPDRLRSMVREVNATQVDSQEQLSDSLYYYDRVSDAVTLVDR